MNNEGNTDSLPKPKKRKFVPAHIRRKKNVANKYVYLVPQGKKWRDEWFHINFEANERKSTHKELIVLDLNGTLVWRGPRNQDKSRNGYPRPYLGEFLRFALDNFAVMIWSSAQPASVSDMMNKMLSPYCKEFVRVWDRRFCDLDGQYFNKAHTVKDLDRIVSGFSLGDSPHCNVYGTFNTYTGICSDAKDKWTLNNMIIVDDSESKTALQKDNHIFVSSFENPLAIKKDGSPADDELLRFKHYLEAYVSQREQYPNLLDYLTANPWLAYRDSGD
ncbi:hypothetical protein IW147_002319 [Coemansia sp. RSA 720]|nr:hypothetical protein IW147_002319 [Coemansia sp. RSA 720]KAJ2544948.1 hypothetical protein GGF49_000858 [Coemansia sp. RSA 1853]